MEKIKSLQKVLELSLDHGETVEYDCDITVEEDGKTYKAYTVAIANREFLLYTESATLAYFVDTYGDRVSFELIEINKE